MSETPPRTQHQPELPPEDSTESADTNPVDPGAVGDRTSLRIPVFSDSETARTTPDVSAPAETPGSTPNSSTEGNEGDGSVPIPETPDPSTSFLTPEQRAALLAVANNREQFLTDEQRAALQAIIDGNPPAPDPEAEAAAAAAAAAAREARLRELTRELNESQVGIGLDNALGEYASRKADVELRGGEGKRFWQTGQRKRGEALSQAEEKLFAAQNEYTKRLIAARREVGMYENEELTEAQIEQNISDDFFNEFRHLDTNARRKTLEIRNSRIERRAWYQKAAAGIGNFLNGGKGKGWVRNTGSGLAAGFGVGLTGVGFPITAAVGAGLSGLVRHSSKVDALDKSLQDYKLETMTEGEMRTYQRGMARSGATQDQQAKRLAQEFFGRSRTEGDNALSEARKKAGKNLMKFGLGYAAGGLLGNAVHNKVFNTTANAQPQQPGQAPAAPNTTPAPHNFPPDADIITRGEGWYHQFGDMGLTQDQAKVLFQDRTLMNDLVKEGAAYVDNSARIGGYGINMPSSGRLSAAAMDMIKQAMIAKGF
ncbi:MAG: hypothetical protein WAQ25_03265 [Candidatus Saccharimonas sp.]